MRIPDIKSIFRIRKAQQHFKPVYDAGEFRTLDRPRRINIISFFKKIPNYRIFKRKLLNLDKRQKFIIQTVLLTSLLIVTQIIWEDYRFPMVMILSFFAYVLTSWSLSEDIKGVEWIMLFILPVFFVCFVSLFYFLLPQRMISRITTTVIFFIGMYAILLVENIYNVAAVRTIQLLRAAQSIGLLLSLVVIFLYSNVIYSLRLPFFLNLLCISPVVFLLTLQSFWSIKLEEKIDTNVFLYAFIVSLLIGETALVFSFWPVSISSFSLLISASYYTAVGMYQLRIQEKLFKNTINEYILVYAFTIFLIFITTSWG